MVPEVIENQIDRKPPHVLCPGAHLHICRTPHLEHARYAMTPVSRDRNVTREVEIVASNEELWKDVNTSFALHSRRRIEFSKDSFDTIQSSTSFEKTCDSFEKVFEDSELQRIQSNTKMRNGNG
jgi:hypothetical protein